MAPTSASSRPEANATLGDGAIFRARRLLGGVLVGEAAARGLLLALDLRPDRGELLLDQALRHFERIARRERVEQLALDLLARGASVVGADALAQRLLELIEAFRAQALGEFVVDGEGLRRRDGLHRHVEIGLLAGELAHRVGLGKRRLNRAPLARDRSEELFLEAGNEGVGADHDLDALARAALERLAVDRADEIDRDAIEVFGLGALGLVGVDAPILGEALERGLDFALLDVGDRPLERQMSENSPTSNFGSTSSATLKARSPRASRAASIASLSVGSSILGSWARRRPLSSTICLLAALIAS